MNEKLSACRIYHTKNAARNPGAVEVSCPWCVHKYWFWTDLIVSESQTPEMFYNVKAAYEPILYLENYSSERVSELTRLQFQLVRDKRVIATNAAAARAPKCTDQPGTVYTREGCTGELEHCPA